MKRLSAARLMRLEELRMGWEHTGLLWSVDATERLQARVIHDLEAEGHASPGRLPPAQMRELVRDGSSRGRA